MAEVAGGGLCIGWGLGPTRGNTLVPSLCLSLCLTSPCFQEELFTLVFAVTTPMDPLTIVLKETFEVFKDELSLCSQGFPGCQTRKCV